MLALLMLAKLCSKLNSMNSHEDHRVELMS